MPFRLRPIRETDLAGLNSLVASIQVNLTSLPNNPHYLEEKLHLSLRSFHPRIQKPGGEYYLFVLEETGSGELAGCCGIVARVGGYDPFFNYEIMPERVTHAPQGIDTKIPVLHLRTDHKGPSEVGSLYLRQEYRQAGLGRLLSLSRFLFMGQFPARFEDTVVAEMRGWVDEAHGSPFWEAICRPFFGTDFRTADILSGIGDKEFIANLMPKYPIYVPLLPPGAQHVIQRVHPNTEPALKMLLDEGFEMTNRIDIFDGGPMLMGETKNLRPVRERKVATVAEVVERVAPTEPRTLLANTLLDFRSCLGGVEEIRPGMARIDRECADLLELRAGAALQYVPVHGAGRRAP